MLFRHIASSLFALLVVAPALAVSVSDRSPFAQGHWWDPTRSGSGFDPATTTGRSVMFRNGTIYVGNGVFWRQDSAWNVFGPY